MARSFFSRSTLGALFAVCALPTLAAAGGFQFELRTINATTAHVKVTFNHGWSCLGPCRMETVTIHVTPCPPGQPCTNGEYVFTAQAQYVSDEIWMDLQTGETYTFVGAYQEVGSSSSSNCNGNCSRSEDLALVQYHVPEAPTWDIVPVAYGEGTVWVEARVSNITPNICAGINCMQEFARYLITPCPLVVTSSNPYYECLGGRLNFKMYQVPYKVRFALQAGVTYTFASDMTVEGRCPANGDNCGEICCDFTAIAVTKEYTPTTVAVTPTTWGKVKAFYRTP